MSRGYTRALKDTGWHWPNATIPLTIDGDTIAEVTLPNGQNVSDLAVSLGFAQYWNGEGPRPGG